MGELGAPVDRWLPPRAPAAEPMQGRYCRLEPLDAVAHAADLFAAYQGHDALWDYLPYGPFDAPEPFAAWLEDTVARPECLFFAIRPHLSGCVEGVASYLRIDPQQGSIEVGNLNFSPALARTRAATEAMALMMGRAFELGYRRYEWKCNALNLPSRRAAQRLGFSFEGVFRQAAVVKGRNRDTAWFAVIDAEWPTLETAYAQWLSPDAFDDRGRQRISLSDLTRPMLVQTDPILSGAV